jgi:ribosomal protein S18 acetylase RimI-like enzyme
LIIKKATLKDLPGLLAVNATLVNSLVNHAAYIKKTVKAGKCYTAIISGKVAGLGIMENIFDQLGYISLLVTHPDYRRQGVAAALIERMGTVCPTPKLFTSTNQSNVTAQKTYEAVGFVRSGYVENLDEGDPEIFYFKRLKKTSAQDKKLKRDGGQ